LSNAHKLRILLQGRSYKPVASRLYTVSGYKKAVHCPINRFTSFDFIRRERLKYSYSQSLS